MFDFIKIYDQSVSPQPIGFRKPFKPPIPPPVPPKPKKIYKLTELGFTNGRYIDQTVKLQALIDTATAEGGILNFEGLSMGIKDKLSVKSNVELYNGNIKFLNLAQIFVEGNKAGINEFNIDSTGYGDGALGVIEFVEAMNPIMRKVNITGNHLYKGFLCKSQCSNARFEECSVNGLGWGILFNDSVTEQGENYRIVKGKNYKGIPMGYGVFISKFKFTAGPTRYGDGIEINTPDHGFSNVDIIECEINGTNATVSNGIGIGVARANNVLFDSCIVNNSKFDGLHIEKGTNCVIRNCVATTCGRALGISHMRNAEIHNNKFKDCGTWIAAYNRLKQYDRMENITIRNNEWVGTISPTIVTPSYACLFGNATNLIIKENLFEGYAGNANAAIVQFYDAGAGTVNNSFVINNTFKKGASTIDPNSMISMLNESADNTITGNTFIGGGTYTAIRIAGSKVTNTVQSNTTIAI